MKMEDKILEVRMSRVREAAKHCGNGETILRKLFPEAFSENGHYIGTVFVSVGKGVQERLLLTQSDNRTARLVHLNDGRLFNTHAYKRPTAGKVMIPDMHLVGFTVEKEMTNDPTMTRKTMDDEFEDE
jgi:hypothetical protein